MIAALLACGVCAVRSYSQSAESGDDSAKKLMAAMESEEQQGTYVFYTQSFIDRENKRADYRGSVRGAIRSFHADRCHMSFDIVLQDYFAGKVGKSETGHLQDSYVYSIDFTLTRAIAHDLALTRARPVQLVETTHAICAEKPSCSFVWLTVRAPGPTIRESEAINQIPNFKGWTDHFQAPVSSVQAGEDLIQKMRAVADAGCP
ncbi:MAG TPA: hypothetical protein VFB43_16560 [Terracidiphilus sp.]|jgi:hypothetical protein|nr:hypothetical protein [Terracidiphilus sp.]